MTTLPGRIKHEFMKALPPTIYFFIILHFVALIRTLMIRGAGVPLPVYRVIAERARVIGRDGLKTMFFGPLPARST